MRYRKTIIVEEHCELDDGTTLVIPFETTVRESFYNSVYAQQKRRSKSITMQRNARREAKKAHYAKW